MDKYMDLAINLAKKGRGFTNPNPLVGAVIVKDGEIIGQGYHEKVGEAHAEINAFKNATESVDDATMYVTLEPCSHYGKTPPCADAIIKNNIKKVVVGMLDPNPLVAGNGVKKLQEAGIEVEVGVMEDSVREINEIFLKYITTKKPFCIMKTAMTMDGKIATKTGDSKWISSTESRKYVHQIRNRVSGIMVGIDTVLTDNPYLTTRLDRESKNPLRIIVDSSLRIKMDLNVLKVDDETKTLIATTDKASIDKVNLLKDKGVEVLICKSKNGRVDLSYLITELGKRGIDSILIEGGGTLNYSALEEGVVDKVLSFISPKIFGGSSVTPVTGIGVNKVSEAFMLIDIDYKKIGSDILVSAYVKR